MKWFFNPFERVAGWPALIIGIVVMALTAVIGKINHVAFDGVLDVHTGASFGFPASFVMQAVDFLSLFLTMWIAGVCFSKSRFRAVDVAGTMALARSPMLLLVVICFLPIAPHGLYDIPRMIIFGLVSIPVCIWMIALMYKAYTVSCHLKGNRAVASFIGALLVAEIVSKLVFIFLLSALFTNNPATGAPAKDVTENTVVVADTLTIRQKTENVVKAFEQGKFEAITVYFDETMKKSLSTSSLKLVWIQSNFTFGKYEKAEMDNLKEFQVNQYDIIEVPFHFKKETLKLRLTFNSDGQISGLFLQRVK